MKTILYISALFLLSILTIQVMAAAPRKQKSASKAIPKSDLPKTEKTSPGNTKVKSGWLNKKQFPAIQDHPCPFYIESIGC